VEVCAMSAGRIWRNWSIVAALACGAILAGGGPAAAGVWPALAAGDISTVAGVSAARPRPPR
jgi:hypothetical protein